MAPASFLTVLTFVSLDSSIYNVSPISNIFFVEGLHVYYPLKIP